MTNYDKLINTLKEVFMLDKAELDFGIYRIMNQKRKDIEQFLEVDLVPQVKEILRTNQALDSEQIKRQIDNEIETAKKYGNANPDDLPLVKELKALYERSGDLTSIENEVFSLLANFFKRYFDNGDFISMRRYKKDVYAIPYEGEEVKLHWANADQYYIKTSEYFKVYRFKLANGKMVAFELIEASTEQNNNKTQGDKERRFAIFTEKVCEVAGDEFKIYFTYEPVDKKIKQSDLLEQAFDAVKTQIPHDFADLLSLRPTEKDKQRCLLQKHLLDYTARNTFDYFIHKDLGGFLERELDFYIKNEVLFIDDLNTRDEQEFLKQLSKIKAIKKIGEKIITFLAQLENFQKKLWLKKKMVVECNYCITLDRVPKDLYPEILTNQAQIKEWIKLFSIDDIQTKEATGLFPESKASFTNPLTLDFLNQNQFLVIDTAFFSEIFKWKLISLIENIDDQCDGLLVNSENFQGLRFIRKSFENKLRICYIDPPFNLGETGDYLYKVDYKDSTWISLLENRLEELHYLLHEKGSIFLRCNHDGNMYVRLLLSNIFGWDNYRNEIIVRRAEESKGDLNKQFDSLKSITVNYDNIYWFSKYASTRFNRFLKPISEEKGKSHWHSFWKAEDRPNLRYDIEGIDLSQYRGQWMWKKERAYKAVENYKLYLQEKEQTGISLEEYWEKTEKSKEFIKKEGTGISAVKYWIPPRTFVMADNNWLDIKGYANNWGFRTENSEVLLRRVIESQTEEGEFVIDYFDGSGTSTAVAHKLGRKWIGIEMGQHFDYVTKVRMIKVIGGDKSGISKEVGYDFGGCFKYVKLENYEDTLNNLSLKPTETQQKAIELNPTFKEGYMLNYMLDVEAKDSLLNLEWFVNPFNCYLNITKNNELQPTKVDLIETFNYLIGLVVESYAVPKEGYVVVIGKNLAGERILVVWRDCNQHNSTSLNQFLEKSKYNPLDTEYDRIYVNGDNNVENLKIGDERWKVVLIEEEFGKRMFE